MLLLVLLRWPIWKFDFSHAWMRLPSLIIIFIITWMTLISHVIFLFWGWLCIAQCPLAWSLPHNTQLWTDCWCWAWDKFWSSYGSVEIFFIRASNYWVISLCWANNTAWVYSSNILFFFTRILLFYTSKSLDAIFSINALASSSVFDLIMPLAEASNINFVCALSLFKKMLIYVGLSNSWIRVFFSNPLNLYYAWLNVSS